MLKGLDVDVLKIIQEIIKTKKQTKSAVIVVDDIKTLLEPKKQEGPIEQQTCTVLIDPTPNVTTAEGVEG